MVYWLLLLVTIIFEVAGTIAMKLSNGLTKLIPSVLIFVFYGICFSVFAIVVKDSFKYCLCNLVWCWDVTYYDY